MVMGFSIVSVETSLLDNAIIINFSKDIDPDSVNPDDIYVMEHDSRVIVPFDIDVEKNFVKITSKSGFEPDTNYTILIQVGISDLVGTTLEAPLMREVRFGSDVTNTVRIVEPIDFEIVHEVALKWQEYDRNGKIIADKDIKDSFDIQIACENAFYNVICDTTTISGDTDAVLKEPIEDGQYYFRIRAHNGEYFGRWSNVGTFVFKKQDVVPEPEPVPEPVPDEEPVDDEPKPEVTEGGITIVDFASTKGVLDKPTYKGLTETGDTSFQFVFEEPVDITDMKILVRRSDV